MATKDEALKMAIKEMTDAIPHLDIHFDDYFEAINACKEALEQPTVAELNDEYLRDTDVIGLEQPTQEPVAHIKQGMDGYPKLVFNGTFQYDSIAAKQPDIALYIKEQL